MSETKYIAGAGGKGGGGGGGGVEADDTLKSGQFANVLDLLSEGEIQGLEDGSKSIFFDGTPLQASDGTNNFQGYTVATRNGTQGQTYIPTVSGNVESETPVNVAVTKSTPVVRTISDTDVNRVRVTVSVPVLREVKSNGDIVGASVSISIQVQYSGGSYTTIKTDTITGKSSSTYQRDYLISLTGAFPVNIRVVRNTDDSSTISLSNDTRWDSFTQIIDAKLAYPNSALVGLRFDSAQFNGIPQRKYLIRGIKVRIPSNATVDTTVFPGRITYSGIWDGTFQAATWTNDPAWCLWDLLTNERYGAGVPESTLDRYDFFAISQYCNELVPSGIEEVFEPRFSCNILINQRREVYNVIQEMSSIFRGISYYGAGSLVLLQDKPADPQYALGPSNVVDGIFTYSGSSIRSRHTCATVAYHNYDDLGEISFEYVEDDEAVARYGVNNKDIKAVGCYSQGQANRLGKWTLLSEKDLYETCDFSVGIDSGIVLRPGMVVDIVDPLRGGTRRNGRISSTTASTTDVIQVDSGFISGSTDPNDISFDLSKNPTLSVVLPTGLVEVRAISSMSGSAVFVSPPFSQAPAANAHWLIQTTDIQSQQFRVVSVSDNEDGVFAVSAIKYNESIYNAVEQDLKLTQRDITNLNPSPTAPTNITGTEFLYQEGQTIHVGFSLGWVHDRINTNDFIVKYKIDNDNFTTINTSNTSLTLRALRAGTLTVSIIPRSFVGKQGNAATATFAIAGKTAPPGNVQNLTIEPISANSARLKWDQSVDIDVIIGGKVHIRHSSKTDGSATFSNSVDLITAIPGASTDVVVPLLEGEYIVKFADDGGRFSPDDTSVIADLPDALGKLLVKEHREDQQTPLPFQGTHVDTFYSAHYDALTLDGSDLIDSVADFDAIPNIDFLGNIKPLGTYTLLDTIDMGLALDAVEFQRHIVARGLLPGDTIDARTALIDTWADFDGAQVNNVNAEVYIRATNDDPSGTPTYGAWTPFNSGTFRGRGFQFKTELTSTKVDENILVDELGYKIELTPRFDQSTAVIASGASTKSVTFAKPFFVGTSALLGANSRLPSVGITVQNLGPNERFNISNVSSTGFDIDVLDSSGNNVDRDFTYTANGYGRGQ